MKFVALDTTALAAKAPEAGLEVATAAKGLSGGAAAISGDAAAAAALVDFTAGPDSEGRN